MLLHVPAQKPPGFPDVAQEIGGTLLPHVPHKKAVRLSCSYNDLKLETLKIEIPLHIPRVGGLEADNNIQLTYN